MESIGSTDARDALRLTETVRARTDSGARAYAWVMLAGAVFISAYFAVWIAIAALQPVGGASAPVMALLPVVILYSGLAGGTRLRFDILVKARRIDIVVMVLALAGFTAIALVALFAGPIPVWIGPVAGLVSLVAVGARPAATIARTRREPRSAAAERTPLTPAARWVTVLIGALLAATVATLPSEVPAAITSLVVVLAVAALVIVPSSPFGCTRAGSEWSRPQWTGFGLAAAAVFGYALAAAANVVVPLLNIVVAVLVVAVMAAAALAPTRRP